MTRRQLLALASGFLPMACRQKDPAVEKKEPSIVGKKGLCLSGKSRPIEINNKLLEAVDAQWLYNWNSQAPPVLPKGIAFTPMIYSAGKNINDHVAQVKAQTREQGFTELLGYNEPDAKSQGNTSVEDALNAWPKLESTGLRLGSPATVHADNEWMIAFMKGVKERGLRVDFVCMHSYGGPGVDSLIKKINKVYEMYQKPIWITEFAVADWEAESPEKNRFQPQRIADFVSELLPKLEAMDIVERYAWFHGGVSGAALVSSQLANEDGALTVVGEAYLGKRAS